MNRNCSRGEEPSSSDHLSAVLKRRKSHSQDENICKAGKEVSTSLLGLKSCGWIDPLKPLQRSYKKLQPFVEDFSRTSFDFQGQPTRNVSHRSVHKIMPIPSPSLQT